MSVFTLGSLLARGFAWVMLLLFPIIGKGWSQDQRQNACLAVVLYFAIGNEMRILGRWMERKTTEPAP